MMLLINTTLLRAVLLLTSLATLAVATDKVPCPKPYHYDCALRGHTVTHSIATYPNATDPYTCSILCLQIFQCASYSFNQENRVCRVYEQELRRQIYVHHFTPNASSTTLFYTYDCFYCRFPCPTLTGVNLLANPGFESPYQTLPSSLSPWGSNSDATLTSPGLNSSKAAGGEGPNLSISQSFKYCAFQLYDISFNFKIHYGNIKNLSHAVYLTAGDLSSNGVIPVTLPEDTWMPYRSTITVSPQTTATFNVLLYNLEGNANDTSKYWIDNVAVTPTTTSLTPKPNATELLINGNFEKNTTKPFTVSELDSATPNITYLSIVSPGYAGSKYALQYLPPYEGQEFDASSYRLSQILSTKPDKSYVLGFAFLLRNVTIKGNPYQCQININSPQQFGIGIFPMGEVAGPSQSDYFSPGVHVEEHDVWYSFARVVNGLYLSGTNGTMVNLDFGTFAGCPLLIDNLSFREAS